MQTFDVVQFALLAGSMIAAFASALWLIRERGKTASQNSALRAKLETTNLRLNQLEAVSAADGQLAAIWSNDTAQPVLIGNLEPGSGVPASKSQILAFGRWLETRSASRLESAIDELRSTATPFLDIVETLHGIPIEVSGRTSAGSAIVRFANLSVERQKHAQLKASHERLDANLKTFKKVMDALDMPIWLRNEAGELAWVNEEFAKAVDCKNWVEATDRRAELFGSQARQTIQQIRDNDGIYVGPQSTVVHSDRVLYEVFEAKGIDGSAGIAIDNSEKDEAKNELNKTIRNHEETLDELTTAVAMFDENQKLKFHNQAFAKLWDFDQAFLNEVPDVSMALDRLRTDGQLPEQPEWRRWKNELLEAFRATEPQEHWWHLTDGRTVRVIANPLPKGGLTWVFENLTERIDLESRYKTMVQVQGETLDNLAEGVAVFGSDGRLQLANPAFERFWNLDLGKEPEGVHIGSIANMIAERGDDESDWNNFAGIVTGFDEGRRSDVGRVRTGDNTLSWMVVPLPNGQTMITFVDVSAADQIERALRDRNEALERTATLKNRFIQHVSYELRSPLTSIMGFTDLISMEHIGELNKKQREYIDYIESSSRSLLDTTDDILDLASIDAGVLELSLEKVEIQSVMQQAADVVREQFTSNNIEIVVRNAPDVGSITADRERLVQVVCNVLTNAANFAPAYSTVTFDCERKNESVIFKIRDKGPGIDPELIKDLFERFNMHGGGRKRGTGLGLAIVKSFVDLHGGEVEINSEPDKGTEVLMTFPDVPSHVSVAAE